MNTIKKRKYSLIGVDGNAYAILGYVKFAMLKEKCSDEEIENYEKDATSEDYSHLIRVSMAMIDKLNGGQNND